MSQTEGVFPGTLANKKAATMARELWPKGQWGFAELLQYCLSFSVCPVECLPLILTPFKPIICIPVQAFLKQLLISRKVNLWRITWERLNKLKVRLRSDPSSPTSRYIFRRKKRMSPRGICTVFTVAQQTIYGNNLISHRWKMSGSIKHSTHRVIIQPQKGETPAIFDNSDIPRGYYAKWNKPDTER